MKNEVTLWSHTVLYFRRYGNLENGRFCFEGGSRCGKGEGVHILRVDQPEELQMAFDLATKGKLEAKRKAVAKPCEYSGILFIAMVPYILFQRFKDK